MSGKPIRVLLVVEPSKVLFYCMTYTIPKTRISSSSILSITVSPYEILRISGKSIMVVLQSGLLALQVGVGKDFEVLVKCIPQVSHNPNPL